MATFTMSYRNQIAEITIDEKAKRVCGVGVIADLSGRVIAYTDLQFEAETLGGAQAEFHRIVDNRASNS